MITLKNGDGIKWPHGKRIAVLLTFDFDAEYLRGRARSAFRIFRAGSTDRTKA